MNTSENMPARLCILYRTGGKPVEWKASSITKVLLPQTLIWSSFAGGCAILNPESLIIQGLQCYQVYALVASKMYRKIVTFARTINHPLQF